MMECNETRDRAGKRITIGWRERERDRNCVSNHYQNALTVPFKTRNFNVNNSAIRHKFNDTSPLVPSMTFFKQKKNQHLTDWQIRKIP